MARKQETDENVYEGSPGFDVTCVIGRVEFVGEGDYNPYEAAFLLVARHDTPGTFKFEIHEMEYAVTVEQRNVRQVR